MEDATIIALAGIAATALSPLLHGLMQARNQHKGRLLDLRTEAYADALRVVSHVYDNLETWAATPQADLAEPSLEEIRQVDARVRSIGTQRVRENMSAIQKLASRFYRELDFARRSHHRVKNVEGYPDTEETIQQRMALGDLVDEYRSRLEQLERAIRDDLG